MCRLCAPGPGFSSLRPGYDPDRTCAPVRVAVDLTCVSGCSSPAPVSPTAPSAAGGC